MFLQIQLCYALLEILSYFETLYRRIVKNKYLLQNYTQFKLIWIVIRYEIISGSLTHFHML